MTVRRLRLLFLGLDGADPRVLRRLLATRRLPHLARLAGAGGLRELRSTVPAATCPAWATCLTGVGPGRHGVFDFTQPAGYGIRFGMPRPAVPTWLESLAAAGLAVGAIGFPVRLHADATLRFHVAGWQTPLDDAASRRDVHPRALFAEIRRALGADALRFAAWDEFAARAAPHGDSFVHALRESVRARTALALFLQVVRPVDVLAVHVQTLDTAGHHAWPRVDEPGAEAERGATPPIPAALAAAYEAVDEALGTLQRELEPAHVVAVSDHGLGPTSDLVVSLNALLVAGGFQRRARASLLGAASRAARRLVLHRLPGAPRRLAFRLAGTALPAATESLARAAGIDWTRSAAFSDELTYAPAVRLNVRGREPQGIVEPAARRRTAETIAAWLRTVRRPDGGVLFDEVLAREEAYDGPFVERAPDVLLRLTEDPAGRMPVLCPPHLRTTLGPDWHMRVPDAERAGRKGGLLRGSHRPLGVVLASSSIPSLAGPRTPDLRDVAPAVHELLGLPRPAAAAPEGGGATPAGQAAPGDDGLTADDARILAARLRALGYIEEGDR